MEAMPPPMNAADGGQPRRRAAGRALTAKTAGADHEDADQERQQRREDQIVDREGQPRRQHADEMHGPDRHRQRDRRPRQQQAPPQAHGTADLHRQAQAHIGALDRHDQREHDEPRLVRHWHCRHSFARTRRFEPIRRWVLGAIIDEFAAGATRSHRRLDRTETAVSKFAITARQARARPAAVGAGHL